MPLIARLPLLCTKLSSLLTRILKYMFVLPGLTTDVCGHSNWSGRELLCWRRLCAMNRRSRRFESHAGNRWESLEIGEPNRPERYDWTRADRVSFCKEVDAN